MLQDPENYDEQAITIYADSLDQARAKAEAEAQYLSLDVQVFRWRI